MRCHYSSRFCRVKAIYAIALKECQCSGLCLLISYVYRTDCVNRLINELLMWSAIFHPTDMTTERCCTTPLSAWYLEDDGWVPFAS